MDVSQTRHVKRARKNHVCNWCYQTIDLGTSYKTWFTFGEAVTARMHPECYEAMLNADLSDDDYLPTAGTYRRGCWCEEKECICKLTIGG